MTDPRDDRENYDEAGRYWGPGRDEVPTADPVYIGIDPGTSCGWAVLDIDGAPIESGTWSLKTKRHEGAGMRYLRLRQLVAALLDEYTALGPVCLAVEEVRRHAGTSAAHVYGGIVAVIMAECERLGVPYVSIPVATVKQTATGRGRASKTDMMDAARERWLVELADDEDDHADALWVAEALRRQLGGAA